jgi:hypothetical protein
MEEAMCMVVGRLKGLRALVRRYLDDAAMRRELRAEFAELGGDLDRVLAEIGLTHDELDTLIQNAPRSRMLMQSMLRRLGLEKRLAMVAPQLVRNIERHCAMCGSQRECADWMAKGAPGDAYRRFCPNAEALDALQRTGRIV